MKKAEEKEIYKDVAEHKWLKNLLETVDRELGSYGAQGIEQQRVLMKGKIRLLRKDWPKYNIHEESKVFKAEKYLPESLLPLRKAAFERNASLETALTQSSPNSFVTLWNNLVETGVLFCYKKSHKIRYTRSQYRELLSKKLQQIKHDREV